MARVSYSEGLARDLVRLVQDARRSASFAITDRITITLQPRNGLDLEPVLASHNAYIRSETLADTLQIGPVEEGAYATEVELDGGKAMIGVKRT